ncbi:AGE family epimerase/isomerase [Paenibacillus sp. SI8]|uniref:AGE family epimerase/isomerase n=1 Tax=unclassified Paenibacillus TaxID=185978 RepID=UPI0034678D01
MNPALLKQEMSSELEHILQFWMQHTIDRQHSGFYGRIDSDMTVHPEAPKGLVLNARILWTFARAYRHEPKPEYLDIAERALEYLETYFRDSEYPGYFWMVDYQGNPLQTKKQIYGQAFYLYAISEYILATGREDLLNLAEQLFEIVEKSFDPVHGGYLEAYARNWSEEGDLRLGEHDQNDKKSMNTHLHILEAYTNYYRVCKSTKLEKQFHRLIVDTIERIIDLDKGHFHLFFDEDWSLKSNLVSYGHDIEGSWLLLEAAEVLGDPTLIERSKQAALRMAEAVLEEGVDSDGAVMWEGDADRVLDTDKHWWGQAEAVVGFVNAWQLTGEERYWKAAADCWHFIREHIIDKDNGEWYWRTDKGGKPSLAESKVNEWKCPYHNSRACFEIIERLNTY